MFKKSLFCSVAVFSLMTGLSPVFAAGSSFSEGDEDDTFSVSCSASSLSGEFEGGPRFALSSSGSPFQGNGVGEKGEEQHIASPGSVALSLDDSAASSGKVSSVALSAFSVSPAESLGGAEECSLGDQTSAVLYQPEDLQAAQNRTLRLFLSEFVVNRGSLRP